MELVVGTCSNVDTFSHCDRDSDTCWYITPMPVKVGEIQNHDVLYIPEKDVIFCKNTTLRFPLIERIIRGSMERTSIPEKELVIIKDNNIVHLGCLTTTMQNCLEIRKQVNKLKLKIKQNETNFI